MDFDQLSKDMATFQVSLDAICSLPPELWSLICDSLDLTDAKNFRLVCRVFNNFGVRSVLRKISFGMDMRDFSRLRTIANDPKSIYVQSLVYTPIFDKLYCPAGLWEISGNAGRQWKLRRVMKRGEEVKERRSGPCDVVSALRKFMVDGGCCPISSVNMRPAPLLISSHGSSVYE